MSAYSNLIEMQEASCQKFKDRPMYGKRAADGQFNWTTFGEFAGLVDDMRGGLASLGVTTGDKVAIISRNSVQWAVAAYATYGLQAGFTAMYEDQLLKDWQFIIEDSGAKVVFVYDDRIFEQVSSLIGQIDTLEHVINITGDAAASNSYDYLSNVGKQTPVAAVQPTSDMPMGMIYTSGTTGKPKGVILSHGNLLSNVNAINDLIDFTPEDRTLCFLPWAHIFGQLAEVHSLLICGYSAAFVDDVSLLVKDLAEVQPTVLYSVPRVFNRIYDAVQQSIKEKGGLAVYLLDKGMELAGKKNAGESLGLIDSLILSVADKIVFSKVRDRFGGKLRFAISGAAALNRDVAEFIANLGVIVYEGYGLSETSPMVTCNSKQGHRIGSVGKVIPGVRVELDVTKGGDDTTSGEIIVHGPNVMQGYHNRPEDTADVMTSDGGFKTGDLGRFDDDGFLYIVGRIKEQYKLENGKYVVPAPIEEKLQISPYIDQVLLYGDNKLFNVVMIVPSQENLAKWAAENNVAETGDALLALDAVQQLFTDELTRCAEGVKGYERPKKFVFAPEPWTPDNGMMTPTMKLKRPVVLKAMQPALDALYD